MSEVSCDEELFGGDNELNGSLKNSLPPPSYFYENEC